MNKIIQLVTSSRVVVGSAFALAFVMGAIILAPQAHAETQNITVSENLTVGMAGASVVTLQALLSEMGYLNVPAGIPLGYYGSMTKNAVVNYQARLNVTPAVGYYGPVTKVALFNDFSSRGYANLLGWND
ncbi:MAG: peptidoglycan-binding protein [Patescibacteria group bacterium]